MLNIPWVGMRCAPSGVLGAILLLATGCGLQHYQAAPLDQQQRVTANAVAQLDDRQLGASLVRLDAATRWPLSSWAPAQLALSAALRSAPVQEARAQLVTALAGRGVAARRASPTVSLAIEHHSDRDDNQNSDWSVGPSVAFSLSPQSRKRIAVALADSSVVVARADLLESAWQAHDAGLRAALEVLEQDQVSALMTRAADARAAVVAAARAQVAAGVDYAFEWQTLELEANSARLTQLQQTRVRQAATAQLAAVLQVPTAALAKLQLEPPAASSEPDYAELQTRALSGHPQVLRALAAYDQAEFALALAVAAQYPEVRLNPGYFFDQGDNVWSLVGGVVVPLFASHDATIKQAGAVRDAAREHFYAVQSATIAELQRAWAEWQAARDSEAATRAVAHDIDNSAEALRRGEHEGIVDKLIVARATLQQADVAIQVARSAALTRRSHAALAMEARTPIDDAPFGVYLAELYGYDPEQTERRP